MLTWTVRHFGSIRVGEAKVPGPPKTAAEGKPVHWVQANVTGTCNVECVLEMNADISLLTEVRCSGKALARMCKSRQLVCTGRDGDEERLAAIVYDPKIASEVKADLAGLPHWENRVAGVRVKFGSHSAAVA